MWKIKVSFLGKRGCCNWQSEQVSERCRSLVPICLASSCSNDQKVWQQPVMFETFDRIWFLEIFLFFSFVSNQMERCTGVFKRNCCLRLTWYEATLLNPAPLLSRQACVLPTFAKKGPRPSPSLGLQDHNQLSMEKYQKTLRLQRLWRTEQDWARTTLEAQIRW